jgi:GPH family glycoside/pentoside/hexuronide:cation symporter
VAYRSIVCFFMGATAYIIPYNALLPELTSTGAERVKLSSFQQVGFVIGIILSALVNNFADLVQRWAHVTDRDAAVQYTIWGLASSRD